MHVNIMCITIDCLGSEVVLPFFDLTVFPGVMELDTTQVDVTSDPINIPDGLIFGDRIVTSVYVSLMYSYGLAIF